MERYAAGWLKRGGQGRLLVHCCVLSLDIGQISRAVGSETLATVALRDSFGEFASLRPSYHHRLMGKELGVVSHAAFAERPDQVFGAMLEALQRRTGIVPSHSTSCGTFDSGHGPSHDVRLYLLACAARWGRSQGTLVVESEAWLNYARAESLGIDAFRTFPPAAAESPDESSGRVRAIRGVLRHLGSASRLSITDVHSISEGVEIETSAGVRLRLGSPGLRVAEREALDRFAHSRTTSDVWSSLRNLMSVRTALSEVLSGHLGVIERICRLHGQRAVRTGGDGVVFASSSSQDLDLLVACKVGWPTRGLMSGVGSADVSDDPYSVLRRAEAAVAFTKMCAGGPGLWGMLARWEPSSLQAPSRYALGRAMLDQQKLNRLQDFRRKWPDLAEQVGLQ